VSGAGKTEREYARGRGAGRTERRRRGRGSGLAEVLVAMSLALVLIVGAAELLTLALAAKRRADVLAALTSALGDRLESLKSGPFGGPDLAAGEYRETGRVEPGRILVDAAWRVEDEGDGVKRIVLKVRRAGNPSPETSAVAYVLRDLGFRP